jgi:ubiquinone/menaquinone biosynthesis C-methylase UbiE
MKPTTTDQVFDLLDAYVTSAALGAAMELGLFWLLAERPLDAPGVAQELGIPPTRCGYWLQTLCKTGLLERVAKEGYALSPVARKAILDANSQATWAFLARESRDRFPAMLDLPLHIRKPGSTWAAQGLTPPDYYAAMVKSPERAREFTHMLYEIHLPLADDLAESLGMSGVRRMLDVGGGSGVMSLALLRRHPQLEVVVLDIANVCAVGQEIARANGMEDRVTYHPADFLRDELPSGFDMVLQCDVGPYSETYYRRLRAVLNPGGRLVAVDQFAPTKGVAHPSRLHWALLGSMERPDATPTTANEVQALLTEAGFEILSARPLATARSSRWLGGWTVIEACRV